MRRLFFVVFLALLSSEVFAIGSVYGKVTQVRVDADGKGMVVFDKAITGEFAACRHSAYTNALSFKGDEAGKAVLAFALSAKVTGVLVTAYGSGVCANYSGHVEDWSYGVMQ